jgi:hypothetical protein
LATFFVRRPSFIKAVNALVMCILLIAKKKNRKVRTKKRLSEDTKRYIESDTGV